MPSSYPKRAFRTPIDVLGNGRLHRAIVDLPESLSEPGRPAQTRVVFFEAPADGSPSSHLIKLLSIAWCMDAHDLAQRGMLTNVRTATELLEEGFGSVETSEMRVLETGAGGHALPAVGPDRIHYARRGDVDLFTTPRVAARLNELLDIVERAGCVNDTRHY